MRLQSKSSWLMKKVFDLSVSIEDEWINHRFLYFFFDLEINSGRGKSERQRSACWFRGVVDSQEWETSSSRRWTFSIYKATQQHNTLKHNKWGGWRVENTIAYIQPHRVARVAFYHVLFPSLNLFIFSL